MDLLGIPVVYVFLILLFFSFLFSASVEYIQNKLCEIILFAPEMPLNLFFFFLLCPAFKSPSFLIQLSIYSQSSSQPVRYSVVHGNSNIAYNWYRRSCGSVASGQNSLAYSPLHRHPKRKGIRLIKSRFYDLQAGWSRRLPAAPGQDPLTQLRHMSNRDLQAVQDKRAARTSSKRERDHCTVEDRAGNQE